MRKLMAVAAALTTLATLATPSASAGAFEFKIIPGDGTATPSFVLNVVAEPKIGDPARLGLEYLSANEDIFRISDPFQDLESLETIESPTGVTVRYGQMHGGIPVWGGQYLVHFAAVGEALRVISANGRYFTDLAASTEPRFGSNAALSLARLHGRHAQIDKVERHGLTVVPIGSGALTYHYTLRGNSYRMPVRYEVFVNAVNGSITFGFNNIQYDGPVQGTGTLSHGTSVPLNLYQRGSNFELRDQSRVMFVPPNGEITTHDAQGAADYTARDGNIGKSSSTTFGTSATNSGVVDAHYHTGIVYQHYLSLGRNSIDGNGGTIESTANVGDVGGQPLFNAFWDGEQMIYGNPDPSQLHPLSADLDVVAHELTHGVIEHTANLAYLGQSGAINEALADYFGNSIDVANSAPTTPEQASFVGEDLCKVAIPDNWACPLRDMNDGSGVDDFQFALIDDDQGGVHYNMTVYSGALWDIREALGGARADQIIYKALSEFHTPLDQFVHGRNATIAAAQALSATPAEIATINGAFDVRGIVEGWDDPGPSGPNVIAENVAPQGFFQTTFAPVASGNRFVVGDYADKRELGEDPMRLYVGNVDGSSSLEEIGDGPLSNESPDIDGSNVVWGHLTEKGGGFDFEVHSRKIGGPIKRVVAAKGTQNYPAVDGNTVVWEDTRSGVSTDIWMKRGSKAPERVTTGKSAKGEQYNPQVSGDWVSWWSQPTLSKGPSIGWKNVVTQEEFRLSPKTAAGFIGVPALGSNFITWYEDGDGDTRGGIYKAKLGATKVVTVVKETSQEFSPIWTGQILGPPVVSTNGTFIAYSDEFAYAVFMTGGTVPKDQVGRDVWVVSAKGGTPELVTGARGDQAYPAVASGSTVIWLDASHGRTNVVRN